MNYTKLEKLINDYSYKNNLSRVDFCGKINITPQGLNKMFKEKSTKVETLEKIAKIIGVSPCELLEESYNVQTKETMAVNEQSSLYETDLKTLNEKLQRFCTELKLKDELINTYHQLIVQKETKDSKK
jgi:transcriptional regulator with XRE-family HTH domain